MEMKKYRDIERLKGENYTLFSEGDRISITEKIDGANCSIRYDSETDNIVAQSRNNVLKPSNTLRGFYEYAQLLDKNKVKECLGDDLILYGEWNVSHSVPYPDDTRNKMYVFDVYSISDEKYLDTHLAYEIADKLGIPKVPVFYEGEFISYEHCKSFVGKTELGGEYGEGVVVKGDNKSIKFVGEKFSETKSIKKKRTPEEIKYEALKYEIVASVITTARVEKIINKLIDKGIIKDAYGVEDLGTIAKYLPKNVVEDCIKEEPEIVSKVSDFSKIASKLCMKTAREICERKYA